MKLIRTGIFVLLIFGVISPMVFGGTATASFSLANSAPPNINQITIQDGYLGGGCDRETWDSGQNYTTHMLNATINWSGASDTNGNPIFGLICVGSRYSGYVQNITNKTILDAAGGDNTNRTLIESACDVIKIFNLTSNPGTTSSNDLKISAGNATLLNNATGSVTVAYRGSGVEYFGVAQRYDNQSTNNVSDIYRFNITLINQEPYFAVHNDAPTGFKILGMGGSFVPTINETHNVTPDFDWDNAINFENAIAPDRCPADTVNYTIIISNNSAYTKIHLHNNTVNISHFNWSGIASLAFNGSETSEGGWSNQTYYIRINATDGHPGGNSDNLDRMFQLTDKLPTYPTGLSINGSNPNDSTYQNETHNQTPTLYWFGATDRENDKLTYYISAGTTPEEDNILSDNSVAAILTDTNRTTNFFGTTIAYSNEGITEDRGQWGNETVYVTIRVNNSASPLFRSKNGGKNYTSSILLTNFLPRVTGVEIHDASSTAGYVECNTRNSTNTNCDLTPVANRNVSLAVRINISDIDLDCNDESYGNWGNGSTTNNISAFFMICINNSNNHDCTDGISNYTLRLDNVSVIVGNATAKKGSSSNPYPQFNWKSNVTCQYRFNINITGNNGNTPQFWIKPGVFMWHVNVTDQGGLVFGAGVTNKTEAQYGVHGGKWQYQTTSAVNFTDTITPGDSSSNNILGSFNDGDSKYVMSNAGNNIVVIQWSSSNFTLTGSSKNWSLKGKESEGDDDFLIDDDPIQGAESGHSNNLTAVIIENSPGESTASADKGYFNYTTGLQVCSKDTCDPNVADGVWNESMPLYFHIRPPVGLIAGTYAATVEYTVEDCNAAGCVYDTY